MQEIDAALAMVRLSNPTRSIAQFVHLIDNCQYSVIRYIRGRYRWQTDPINVNLKADGREAFLQLPSCMHREHFRPGRPNIDTGFDYYVSM